MQPDDQRSNRFGLILLAAGGSSRLGSPKQLVQFEGRSLLRRAAETAIASGAAPIVIVLGSRGDELRDELNGLDVEVVLNNFWEEGMSSSIRLGIVSAAQQDLTAVVLMLCDQPRVTPKVLKALMDAFDQSGKMIVVSDYGTNAIGPPCIFGRAHFANLRQLRGAQGARQIWKHLPHAEITRVEFKLGLVDVDTPEDVARLQSLPSS